MGMALTVGAGVDLDEHFELEIDGTELVVTAFGVEERFDITDFDQVLFDGGNGNDILSLRGVTASNPFDINLYLFGGDGNDSLEGGDATSYIFAGSGNDTLIAQGGSTFLTGGHGDDIYELKGEWGTAVVNENPNSGSDTIDFSGVINDLEINVRGTSQTVDGLNAVAHAANTIERFVGGQGDDIMNLHREEGGLLELSDGLLVWDRVEITHSDIEKIDISFVNSDDDRTGVVRILEDQDYTGSELRIAARGIDIRASIKAGALSLVSTNIIGISQDFEIETGIGRLITLEADKIRSASENGVGDINMPLYIKTDVIEAKTLGAAGIYLAAIGDLEVGDVSFDGITETDAGLMTTAGGNIHLTNLGGVLTVKQDIQASGGGVVITSERMVISEKSPSVDVKIASEREVAGQFFRGTLVLQPLSTKTSIGVATVGVDTDDGGLQFSADEIHRFMNGFDSSGPATFYSGGSLVTLPTVSAINIGRADGSHVITLDTFTYSESFTFRAPVPFGRFDIIGTIFHAPSIVDGQNPSFNFLG